MNISIEAIKREFSRISEYIISVEENGEITLKTRDEIYQSLKSKPLDKQKMIVDELLEIFNIGAISNINLNPENQKGWNRIPFKAFCKTLLKTINNEIEVEVLFEDQKRIKIIKNKLTSLNDKNSKIIYLSNIKNELEGDFPKAISSTLENDDLYLFVVKEINRIQNIPENIKVLKTEIKLPPRLQTKLNTKQRYQLFEELKKVGFISNDTDHFLFNWALRVFDDTEEMKLVEWKSIQFLFRSNHSLRILFEPILGKITNDQIRGIKQLFKDRKGKEYILPKDQYRYSDDIAKIEDILKAIEIEKSLWYTGEKKQTN